MRDRLSKFQILFQYTENHLLLLLLLWVFFTTVLTNDFTLKSAWQQVSSGLQDSSQHSSWFQLYDILDSLDSSFEVGINLEVDKFELQSRYYILFRTNTLGKGMDLLMPPAMG